MRRSATLLILAVAIAPYFLGLTTPGLWDVNETLYAEPPREALETGNWLVPTLNYEPWFVKPPGVTWITLPFYALLGPTELAGRLAMALGAAGTILLTWRIGVRTAGPRAGLLAAVVLATTAKHFLFSRQLAGDVFLTASFTAAIWGYLRWFLSDGTERRGLWIAAASLGLGTLVKGPIALLLPALLLSIHLALARRLDLVRRLRPLGPTLLALAVAAPWFVYMAWRFGEDFVGAYFGHHHFDRFFTSSLGEGRGLKFYPKAYLGDALPWSVALPGAVWATLRAGLWRREPFRLSLLWCVLLVVFFSLSTGKRSVYLLPIYPFVALLVGATIDHLARQARGFRLAGWIVGPLLPLALLVVAGGVWFGRALPLLQASAAAVGVLGGIMALALLFRLRRGDAPGAVMATAAATWGMALVVIASQHRMEAKQPAREFAEFITAHALPGDRTGRYACGLHSLTFYGARAYFTTRDADELRRMCREAQCTWLVLPEARLEELADPHLLVETMLRRPYLQISTGSLRGERPLEQALVVAKITPR